MEFKITHLIFIQLIACIAAKVHYTKLFKNSDDDDSCTVLDDYYLPNYRGLRSGGHKGVKVDISPAVKLPEQNGDDGENHGPKIIEIFAKSKRLSEKHVRSHCERLKAIAPLKSSYHNHRRSIFSRKNEKAPEVRKIVDSGDPSNRIDVVFMGDGYVAEERDQFFGDIDRFVQRMFEGKTLKSYLPLFNIWAIYVESAESGIGYDGAKNTPFKLYRDKGQLRGIFTGNAKYARQVCKLTGPQACDYPSLIANDNYYGGLGGEFVIFTRSNETGEMVLRHEMGHNFIDVGEEYDNGFAYFGPSSSSSLQNLKWSHWLSGEKKEERAMHRILQYPWKDLSEGPANYTFFSDGRYKRWHLTTSVTAAEEDDSLEFLMDGKPLPFKSQGIKDRTFHEWSRNEGFSMGLHTFSVSAKGTKRRNTDSQEIPTMLASVSLHEFGDENEYHTDNEYVSAYPTWNFLRRKTYRPTNAGCIMRNMTHEKFCSVCQEGMWINFLSQISLIDEIIVSDYPEDDGSRMVSVKTLQLGQFRPANQERINGEHMEIKWFKGDLEQTQFMNQPEIKAEPGNWGVKVKFHTPEVRKDQYGFLNSAQTFVVP